MALTEDGDVYSWGINSDGQLGHGHRSDIKTPKKIYLGFKAVDIACGDSHSVVLSGIKFIIYTKSTLLDVVSQKT